MRTLQMNRSSSCRRSTSSYSSSSRCNFLFGLLLLISRWSWPPQASIVSAFSPIRPLTHYQYAININPQVHTTTTSYHYSTSQQSPSSSSLNHHCRHPHHAVGLSLDKSKRRNHAPWQPSAHSGHVRTSYTALSSTLPTTLQVGKRSNRRTTTSTSGTSSLFGSGSHRQSSSSSVALYVTALCHAYNDANNDNDSDSRLLRRWRRACSRSVHEARQKFMARPGTFLLIPCIAAGVGWLTNWLAVQMIFYPISYWGLDLVRRPEVPLGLLGWQGIVPCKTRTMTIAMTDMVTSQLLTIGEAFARLDPNQVATLLSPAQLPFVMTNIVPDILPKGLSATNGIVATGLSWLQPTIGRWHADFVQQLVVGLQQQATDVFSLQNCVVTQMLHNRAQLGDLFQKCCRNELDFLTNSGLWFGFLLGVIQMVIALFWNNPWSLSIGGGIVGLATNWLALKWIFEPVDPRQIGPWLIQGKFLRRQKEVAAEFARYFANKILTGEQMWKSILTDPETKPAFVGLVESHMGSFLQRIPRLLRRPMDAASVSTLTTRIVDALPLHVPALYSYMDGALGLEQTLRTRMEGMTSRKFERVLHPIFEEDELTLIIAGAVLGFMAGLVQQGLETGTIQVPNLRIRPALSSINAWIRQVRLRFVQRWGKRKE